MDRSGIRKGRGGLFFKALLAGFLGLCLVFPVVRVLLSAFFPQGRLSLSFFALLFSSSRTLDLWINSINVASGATLFAGIIAVPLALLFYSRKIPGEALLRTLLLLPMIVPPFVGAVGLRRVLARFGPLNLALLDLGVIHHPIDFLGSAGLFAVAFTQSLHLFPIILLNLSASLSRIDPSLSDAARTIGAGPWQRLKHVVFPLVFQGFMAGAVVVFVWSFTDLGTPLVFDTRDLVAVKIFNQLDEMHTNPASHALVVSVLIMVALLFAVTRRTGFARTASDNVKGITAMTKRPLTRAGLFFAYAGIALLSFMALLPHLGMLLTSVSDEWFMTVLPTKITLRGFREALIHPLTFRSVINSLFLSFGSTILTMLVGLGIAHWVARSRGIVRELVDHAATLPLAIPGLVLAFAYLDAFTGTLLDPRWNPFPLLIIGYTVRRMPVMVRSISAGYAQIGTTLEDAARSAGAPPVQVWRHITVPLISRHLMAGAILCFAFAMLEVSESMMLALEERFYPISKALYVVLGRPDGPMIASALGVLAMLLLAFSFFLASRLLGRRMEEVFGL